MALPTRVSRGVALADPFEAVQREFDVLNRFFAGNGARSRHRAWPPTAWTSARTRTIFTSRLNCRASKRKMWTSPWKTRP